MEVLKPDNRQTRFTQKRYNATSVIYDLMEWPVEQLWFKKWRRRIWNQVDGPKVLEIGVGTGKNISYYTEDLQVTAIDLSPGMLKRSKKKLARNNSDKMKKLADKLNILLANYSVFYQNTRGFHLLPSIL